MHGTFANVMVFGIAEGDTAPEVAPYVPYSRLGARLSCLLRTGLMLALACVAIGALMAAAK